MTLAFNALDFVWNLLYLVSGGCPSWPSQRGTVV